MLIVGRRTNQKIIISDDIEITVLEIGRNRVRFGIEAPKEVSIQTRLQSLPDETESTDGKKDQPLKAMAARRSGPKPSV